MTLAMLTVSLPTMVQVLEIKTQRMNIIFIVQDLIPWSHIAVSQNLFCMRSLPFRILTKVLFCCMVKNLIWFSYFGHAKTKLNFKDNDEELCSSSWKFFSLMHNQAGYCWRRIQQGARFHCWPALANSLLLSFRRLIVLKISFWMSLKE